MDGVSRCIECGGAVRVSRPALTTLVEECVECGRRSHWRLCVACGELNGPRRMICMECGFPFDRKEAIVAATARPARSARPLPR